MTYYCIKCVSADVHIAEKAYKEQIERAAKPEKITRKIALARIGVSLTDPSRLLKHSSREKPVCTPVYKIWREGEVGHQRTSTDQRTSTEELKRSHLE